MTLAVSSRAWFAADEPGTRYVWARRIAISRLNRSADGGENVTLPDDARERAGETRAATVLASTPWRRNSSSAAAR